MLWDKKVGGEKPLVKASPFRQTRKDYRITPEGVVVFVFVLVAGLAWLFRFEGSPGPLAMIVYFGAPLLVLAFMAFLPRWLFTLAMLPLLGLTVYEVPGFRSMLPIAFLVTGALVAPSIQKMEEWERAIVLRFGKFHRVRGPGLFFLAPFADRVAEVVDLRIRVSDFSAETTLTRDSVTVTVDALCFWLVWDAEKAICEVEDYRDAVILSAKTALRSAVSRNDLSEFLADNERIEELIRSEVDAKTTEWGITVQHIEITDIQIPESLQVSLSRVAQAEREKKGRVLLAEAEVEIAKRYAEAAKIYDADQTAMNLKNLAILNEGLASGNSMMLVPNSITEKLEGKDLFGLQALGKLDAREKAERAAGRNAKGLGPANPDNAEGVDTRGGPSDSKEDTI